MAPWPRPHGGRPPRYTMHTAPLPGRYDRDMDDNSRQSAPSTTFWLWVTALNLLAVLAVLWLAG